jgi:hypothetical protein
MQMIELGKALNVRVRDEGKVQSSQARIRYVCEGKKKRKKKKKKENRPCQENPRA